MYSEKDKYRNPPPPLGYVKKMPELVVQEHRNEENIDISAIIKMIIDSGICDEPDVSIYDHFVINPSSDEEEIIEVPVIFSPKNVEVLDITQDDVTCESNKDFITVKKEVESSPLHANAETSEDLVKDSKDCDFLITVKKEMESPPLHANAETFEDLGKYSKDCGVDKKIPSNTQSGCDTNENFLKDKRQKKCDHVIRRKHIKKNKEKRCRSDSYDSSRHYRSKHKNYSDFLSKHDSSDSSDSDSYRRSRYKKRESYGGDCDYNKSLYKKRYSSSTDFRNKKIGEKYNNNSKLSGETSENKKFDFNKEDSDNNSYKTNSVKESKTNKGEYTSVRTVSSTPSPCQVSLSNIKQELDLLCGQYYCKVCKVTMNNEITHRNHINGKRHKKAVENAQDESKTKLEIPDNYPHPTELFSKDPKPPPGYRRKKVDCVSLIQLDLVKKLQFPCPGLNHVTEIRGIAETSYYCSLCNCLCSCNCIIQHLSGFKHQLCCLKYYETDLYERWSYKPKYQIEKDVIRVLKLEESKHGKGVIRVEQEVRETDRNARTEMSGWQGHDMPGTSTQFRDLEFSENYAINSMPDPTKSGYYCKMCESHCNSKAMFDSHTIGKRHLANLKKLPGTAPSKCKYIRAEANVRPFLFDILKKENIDNAPVIGLDQIQEFRKPDINGVLFSCLMCGGSVPSGEIVNHVLSTKHREKYLNRLKHPDMETLQNCPMSPLYRSSIVEDIAAAVEAESGRGTPEVFVTKSAFHRV